MKIYVGHTTRAGRVTGAVDHLVIADRWYSGLTDKAVCGVRVRVTEREAQSGRVYCGRCEKGRLRATLLHHITTVHRRQPAKSMSTPELSKWHAQEHHRYTPRNHYHAGVNRGPDERPPGWRTGEDAVPAYGSTSRIVIDS